MTSFPLWAGHITFFFFFMVCYSFYFPPFQILLILIPLITFRRLYFRLDKVGHSFTSTGDYTSGFICLINLIFICGTDTEQQHKNIPRRHNPQDRTKRPPDLSFVSRQQSLQGRRCGRSTGKDCRRRDKDYQTQQSFTVPKALSLFRGTWIDMK